MIETERLILRGWREEDREPFAAMSRDPDVMRHLDGVVDRAASDAAVDRQIANQAEDGCCFWAIERREDGAFLGFCGIRRGGHENTPVHGVWEIGWRLRRDAWGQGYAREAARACIDWAFATTPADRVYAWTVPANRASWGLMLRLGMSHRPEFDFDHPRFAKGHPLCRHLVYAIDRPA